MGTGEFNNPVLGALLWARNQIDVGQIPAAQVLERIDRVLDEYDVSIGDYRAFLEKFPRPVDQPNRKDSKPDEPFYRCVPRMTK